MYYFKIYLTLVTNRCCILLFKKKPNIFFCFLVYLITLFVFFPVISINEYGLCSYCDNMGHTASNCPISIMEESYDYEF